MEERRSIWRDVQLPGRARLAGDLRADAAVIGAGMAGLLIARALTRRGLRVVVLEAGRIASGQTKNTTAKITSQHGMIYDALLRKFGETAAGQYARANEWAIQSYAQIIRSEKIDCDFREVSSYLYSKAAKAPLEREAEAARRLGIPALFTENTELPFPVKGAVRFDRQAQFHPLKFIQAIIPELEIYENTPVVRAEGDCLHTPQGDVRAANIVFATHYPFVNVPGWFFMRMHQERSYVLALESDFCPDGQYYGVDNDRLSFRTANGLLLVGGENHRTGENEQDGRYETLLSRAQAILPGCREIACWSAQDCVTLDGVPYIGRFSEEAKGWYVATGFAKWGMTSSMVAARIIRGEILGDAPDWANVFSPGRFKLSASAKSLASETAQAFKGLTRAHFTIPEATLASLPKGHGGVVEVDGFKAGVYKDADGRCYQVNPRCPHLGCELTWNPDEKSWDCPCHGSRFRYDGALIDNPAQEGI